MLPAALCRICTKVRLRKDQYSNLHDLVFYSHVTCGQQPQVLCFKHLTAPIRTWPQHGLL